MESWRKRAFGLIAGPGESRKATKSSKIAVAWLQCSLRVADNAILQRAAEAGPGGLAVVVVWRCGDRIPTPAFSFAAAAMTSLHKQLRKRGSGLTVLYSADDSERSAAAAVAAHAARLGATTVVVDCAEEAGDAAATYVRVALGEDAKAVEVVGVQDDTLFTHAQALSLMSDSQAGGGAKVLRWASFLKAAAELPPPLAAAPPPATLPPPPPNTAFGKKLRGLPADSAWWGVPTLDGWLKLTGAPISEEGGQRLAREAGERAVSGGRPGFGVKNLGQRKGAGNDADGRAAPQPAYISPYLRWGVISARQADAAGVRRRDLLWRDFARLCWRVVPALRRGVPVIQATPIDDVETFEPPGGKDPTLATADGKALSHWQWTPALVVPAAPADSAEPAVAAAPAKPAPPAKPAKPASPSKPAPPSKPAAGVVGALGEPTWRALLALSAPEAFEAWCVGRTGAPLVDAAMAQLWVTGWMPRRMRLLCASCLVEGLGLDWRLGRDWFACAARRLERAASAPLDMQTA